MSLVHLLIDFGQPGTIPIFHLYGDAHYMISLLLGLFFGLSLRPACEWFREQKNYSELSRAITVWRQSN
jgi:hypothetical protein